MSRQTKKTGLKFRAIDEDRLGALLQSLQPTLAQEVHEVAIETLVEAIESYRGSFPVVETHADPTDPSKARKRRTRGSLGTRRKQLRDLEVRITDLEEALSRMTYDARHVFWKAYRGTSRLQAELAAAKAGVLCALDSLKADSSHQEDSTRVVLAMDVAQLLTGTLRLKASNSFCAPDASFLPGSTRAAYCRVLRAALEEAGATPAADLRELMGDGLKLLEEIQEEDHVIAETGAGHPAKAATQRNGEA